MGRFWITLDAAPADLPRRGEKAGRKWLEKHEARWHIRPPGEHLRPLKAALSELCAADGAVSRAALAEARDSEDDQPRAIIGIHVKPQAPESFDEVAERLRAGLMERKVLPERHEFVPLTARVQSGDEEGGGNPYLVYLSGVTRPR